MPGKVNVGAEQIYQAERNRTPISISFVVIANSSLTQIRYNARL